MGDFSEDSNMDSTVVLAEREISHLELVLPPSISIESTIANLVVPTQKITIGNFLEPLVFLASVAFSLSLIITPNVIELQYCRTVMHISDEACFQNNSKYQTQIQSFYSNFQICSNFIEVVLPATISFCLGSWSDVYGRKPLLLVSLTGMTISFLLWTCLASFADVRPMVFLVCSIPLALSGGGIVFILAAFCYIGDVTDSSNRTFRFGLTQVALFSGSLVGNISAPWISGNYGYRNAYACCALFSFILLAYTKLIIEESIVRSEGEITAAKNPLHYSHAQNLFNACFTNATKNARISLLLITTILFLSVIVEVGQSNVFYLFLQRKFNWNLQEYSLLSSYSTILAATSALGGIWIFSTKLGFHDLYLTMASTYMRILSSLGLAFALEPWHLYAAKFLNCSVGMVGPLMRNFVSIIMPQSDLGKVYSLITATECLTPFIGTFLYATTYKYAVYTLPDAIFFVSCILLFLIVTILAILIRMNVNADTMLSGIGRH